VNAGREWELPPARSLVALWRLRPAHIFSRSLWPLLLALDMAPFPWGEDLLARIFVAKAFVQVRRLREALAWAASHSADRRGRWRLALSCSSYHGRFVARMALVGVRRPEEFRRRVVLEGTERLGTAGRATILLGFHLGPPEAALALRVAGHRLTWVGGWRNSRAWSREAWRPFQGPGELLWAFEGEKFWGSVLYRACRILRKGGTIFISADGAAGREAFRVPVPGGPVVVRSGWLALRRHTGAQVLPVLTHMEDRTQVVTIHPPLPPLDQDLAADQRACREVLGALLEGHVRRFPEQCYTLAFPPAREATRADGRASIQPRQTHGLSIGKTT